MKIVILNGPPGSGKTTAAHSFCHRTDLRCLVAPMAYPIHTAFASLIGQGIQFFVEGATPYDLHPKKDEVHPVLGVSPRKWKIEFSENFMKRLCGEDIFARIFCHNIDEVAGAINAPEVVVVPDCGFQIEYDVIAKHFSPADILLIHLRREGTSFADDSRGYISADPPTSFVVIENNLSERLFCSHVYDTIQTFVKPDQAPSKEELN